MGICDLNELQQEPSDLKQERTTEYVQQQNGIWNDSSQLVYEKTTTDGGSRSNNNNRGSYGVGIDQNQMQVGRVNSGNCSSNLLRQSSSPAGLFAGFNGRSYFPSFGSSSWNDPASPNSLKRIRDGDMKVFSSFNGLENQNGGQRNTTPGLIHHLSLPKTSSEISAVENYLEFQQDEGVPCKIRAKRGFATHPRSIAERVRRNKISERMKKLQELFPDMDK